MHLYTIETGNFKLDGGAMFGVVPKTIWQNINPADHNNMCSWAMRCLLIEDGKRLILIDNGIGNKQSEKFYGFYYLHGDSTIENSLNKLGFSKDDITDVILTHLHLAEVLSGITTEQNIKLLLEMLLIGAMQNIGRMLLIRTLEKNQVF